jgi:hypothetical protein
MFKLAQRESKVPTTTEDPRAAIKARAKKARRDAYVAAKERNKNDPRQIERKAQMKEARRAMNKAAKEKRKTDPNEIARKAKQKSDRQAMTKRAKVDREKPTE